MALLAPVGSWRLVPGADLPTVFPESFRRKIDAALVIAEQTSTGDVYLVHAMRVDPVRPK